MRLEQAIFTSLQGSRLEGYQLAATSPGITAERARELTRWGPAHDSLASDLPTGRSVNFHRLEDDEFCLSCTTLAGSEYSGRGGGRIYTQMFVLSREVLERFANDPFLIVRALDAAGRLMVHDPVPDSLPRVPLVGRCQQPDPQSIAEALDQIGSENLEEMVTSLANGQSVAVAATGQVEHLFQAVLHTLTPPERLTVSFTTGLKHSTCRSFRLFVLPNDGQILRQAKRQAGACVIDLTSADTA